MVFVASNPLNLAVLEHLRGRLKSTEPAAVPDSVADPYMSQGSHPDIVERVWDGLGSSLPADCRCLVYGDPALVQPQSGIILVFCLGTAYCLRLSPAGMAEASRLGARRTTRWASGNITDTTRTFGPDWIFGSWKAEEARWCRDVYDLYDEPVQQS